MAQPLGAVRGAGAGVVTGAGSGPWRYRLGATTIDASMPLPGLDANRVPRDNCGTIHLHVRATPEVPLDGPVVLSGGVLRRLEVRAIPTGGWVFDAAGTLAWTLGSDRSTLTAHTGDRRLSTDDVDFLRSAVIPRALVAHGVHVLHAAGLMTDDGVVLACGPSGAGKSTLAAAFAYRRGVPLLGDDSVVLDIRGSRAVAWACDPDIRMWDTSRALFDCGSGVALGRYLDGAKARYAQPPSEATSGEHNIRAIVRLVAAPEPGRRRLRPADGVMALRDNLLRIDRVNQHQRAGELEAIVRLVARVPVFEVGSPRTAASLDEVVDLVESCAGSIPPEAP
jgi:hypothetical protein